LRRDGTIASQLCRVLIHAEQCVHGDDDTYLDATLALEGGGFWVRETLISEIH
jgi:hypothetical protein